jgi:hypothetical protein
MKKYVDHCSKSEVFDFLLLFESIDLSIAIHIHLAITLTISREEVVWMQVEFPTTGVKSSTNGSAQSKSMTASLYGSKHVRDLVSMRVRYPC